MDGVYKADDLIPPDLKSQFLAQMGALEDDFLSERLLMWHPNSNEQVLDLIHPSMHCFVAGVSRVYSKNQVVDIPWYDFCSADHAKVLSSEKYIEYVTSL